MTRRPVQILLIEDNPGDVDLVLEALRQFTVPHSLHVIGDGAAALEFLETTGAGGSSIPDLILLDLNVPKTDGRAVLTTLKEHPSLRHIPIIVLSSSAAERDLLQAYRLHANCFITKPAELERLFGVFRAIELFWLSTVTLPPRTTADVPGTSRYSS